MKLARYQDRQAVPCLDVESCAGAAPGSYGSNATLARPRYALVLSHHGVPTNRLLQSIKSMRAAALAAGADILVPWLFRGLQECFGIQKLGWDLDSASTLVSHTLHRASARIRC